MTALGREFDFFSPRTYGWFSEEVALEKIPSSAKWTHLFGYVS